MVKSISLAVGHNQLCIFFLYALHPLYLMASLRCVSLIMQIASIQKTRDSWAYRTWCKATQRFVVAWKVCPSSSIETVSVDLPKYMKERYTVTFHCLVLVRKLGRCWYLCSAPLWCYIIFYFPSPVVARQGGFPRQKRNMFECSRSWYKATEWFVSVYYSIMGVRRHRRTIIDICMRYW